MWFTPHNVLLMLEIKPSKGKILLGLGEGYAAIDNDDVNRKSGENDDEAVWGNSHQKLSLKKHVGNSLHGRAIHHINM